MLLFKYLATIQIKTKFWSNPFGKTKLIDIQYKQFNIGCKLIDDRDT